MPKTQTAIEEHVTITPPQINHLVFHVVGDAPYVQHKFSKQDLDKIVSTQKAGSTTRSKRNRDPKDFDRCYDEAIHWSADRKHIGIPSISFRHSMIDACRLVGFKMTHAKQAIAVAHEFIGLDGTLLVKINGDPEPHVGYVRNETGVIDVRIRPMWREWSADVCVTYDADQFTSSDITNLMMRAGAQCGIGEGRPTSPKSFGQGWGTFKIRTSS